MGANFVSDLYRPPLPLALCSVLFVVVFGLATFAYLYPFRHGATRVGHLTRGGLLGLRLIALAALGWMLAGPSTVDSHSNEQTTKPTLTMLVDRSASMAQTDMAQPESTSISRFAALKQSWLSNATLVKLRKLADVRLMGFSDDTRQLHGPDEQSQISNSMNRLGPPTGNRTLLIKAVRQQIEEPKHTGNPVVILSDGHETQRGLDSAFLQQVKQADRPIFAVPVGQADSTPDLAVRAWAKSEFVFAGQRTTIRAQVSQRGFDGRAVRVELRKADQTVDSRLVTLEGPSTMVSFEVQPSAKPRMAVTLADYQVRIALATAPAEESYTANNARHVFLQISRRRIKVLLLEGQPYWDTQRLGRVLQDDPRIDLTARYKISPQRTVIQHESPPAPAGGTLNNQTHAPHAPHAPDGMGFGQFDVVVLGKGIDQFFSDDQAQQRLVDYVTQHGGGLVLARGQPGKTLDRLDPLMPVQWGRRTLKDLRLDLTEAGRGDPLRGLKQFSSNELDAELSQLPGMVAATRIDQRRAGSLVYLNQSPDHGPNMAAVVSMRAGRGQVLAILTDGLWRWDQLPSNLAEYDSVYQLFWSRAIQWLGTGGRFLPGQDMTLTLDRLSVEPGQSLRAKIATRYVDREHFIPTLRWIDPNGKRQTLHATASTSADHTWQATIQPQTPGLHRLELARPTNSDQPKGGDKQVPVQSRFAVRDRSVEKLDTSANRELLQRITDASGGQMLGLHDPAPLISDLHDLRIARRSQTDPHYAFARWPILGLIFACLGLEWFLRRSAGLP